MPFLRFICLSLVIMLGACTTSQKVADYACPESGFAKHAEVLRLFAADQGDKTHENLMLEARLADFEGGCRYNERKAELETSLTLGLRATTGAAGDSLKGQSQTFTYFVAVLGAQEEILQRQAFDLAVQIDAAGAGHAADTLTLKIPVADKDQIGLYKIVMGFVLTPDQLDYNTHKR